jgi:hypothetical protein
MGLAQPAARRNSLQRVRWEMADENEINTLGNWREICFVLDAAQWVTYCNEVS